MLAVMAVLGFTLMVAVPHIAAQTQTVAFLDEEVATRVFETRVPQPSVISRTLVQANPARIENGDSTANRVSCGGARNAPPLTDEMRTEVIAGVPNIWKPRTITRGDTVSGFKQDYSGAMTGAQYFSALRRKNPQITDLNTICADYTINLPTVLDGGGTLADTPATLAKVLELTTELSTEYMARTTAEQKAADLKTELQNMGRDHSARRDELEETRRALAESEASIINLKEAIGINQASYAEHLEALMAAHDAYVDLATQRADQVVSQAKNITTLQGEIDGLKKEIEDAIKKAIAEQEELQSTLDATRVKQTRVEHELVIVLAVFVLVGTILCLWYARRRSRVAARLSAEREEFVQRVAELVGELNEAEDGLEAAVKAARDESRELISALQEENNQRSCVSVLVDIPEDHRALRAVWGHTAAFSKAPGLISGKKQFISTMPCGRMKKATTERILEHLNECTECTDIRRGTSRGTNGTKKSSPVDATANGALVATAVDD
ncbi:MAG: hypothetical protein Q8R39_01570 [bacterium]|nr:hypothetical protein [bacterium]MDZ4284543.1 hypothetical protein [Patescibacteria group bacterium]